MQCAVEDWDDGKGIDKKGDKLTLDQFANLCGIKPDAFQKHACVDRNKRRALGSQVGRKAKLSTDDQEFIVQLTARCDCANGPGGCKETIDAMQNLRPDLSHCQLANHWDHAACQKARRDGLLKRNTVKAQATTAKRDAMTLSQQRCWHCAVDDACSVLQIRNAGRCKLTGESFGEVMHHFIVAGGDGDMAGSQASDGKDRVHGEQKKKKHHETTSHDSCEGI
jgi:hypothetical protein